MAATIRVTGAAATVMIQHNDHLSSQGVTTNGNFARTFDARRIIGIDRAIGRGSSIVTIITGPNGDLVTMFPGRP